MDVLFLDQFSELGGAQKCLLDLLPAIEARGWRASAALPGNGRLVKILCDRNVRVHSIPCGPYRSGGKSISDVLHFTRDLRQQVKILRSLEFDLLYVNGPRMLAAAAMAFGDRAPVLFHAHSRIPAGPQSWLADWSLRRLNATVAACALAVAPRVSSEKLKLIANGTPEMGRATDSLRSREQIGMNPELADESVCPTVTHKDLRSSEPIFSQKVAPDRWRVGMIGAIRPEKGQLEFLRAAATLAPEFKDVRFVICGAPADPRGSYFRTVQKYLDFLPVEFLGWCDDIADVLAGLDLLVIASQSEGMPRVMLEAFSAGVPVVAFPVGGIPEVIRDGETGFLTQDLAARLRLIFQAGPWPLRKIATNARREWEQKYTVEIYRQNITALMEALVSGRPAIRETESRQSRR